MTNHVRGIVLAVGGASLISFDGLLVRLQSFSPASVVFWRGLLSGLAFTLMALLARRAIEPDAEAWDQSWRTTLLVAALMVLGTITFVLSLTHTSVAHTLVIIAAAPLVTGILGHFLLGEHLPARTWLAGIAALAGVVIVVAGGLGSGYLQGDLWALGNTAVLGFLLVSLRRYQNSGRLPALAISSLAVAILVIPWTSGFPDLRTAIAASVDGLLIVPGGLVLITLAPRYLPAAEVSLLLLMETILAPLWVLMALGEALTFGVVLSAAIILGAIAIHSWLDLREQRPPASEPIDA